MNARKSILYGVAILAAVSICGFILIYRVGAASTIQPAATKPAATKPAGTLIIRKAIYGDLPDGAKVDVSEKIRDMVKDGTLSVAASDENFGDPYNGKLRLTITSAQVRVSHINLGGDGGAGDFTDKVKQFQNGNSLHMKITGDMTIMVHYDYGDGKAQTAYSKGDGSLNIGIPTKLRVDYNANGVDADKTVETEQILKIDANDPIQPTEKLAGNVWSVNTDDGEHYEFHFDADGTMHYKSSSGSDDVTGTWTQDGTQVNIEVNHYAKYKGSITGTHFEGAASNNAGKTWNWSGDKE